ncbi:LOW QUALITY PROTEIN: uncharacterized protein WCC33_015994 [Rhinophrynus dorsalis]
MALYWCWAVEEAEDTVMMLGSSRPERRRRRPTSFLDSPGAATKISTSLSHGGAGRGMRGGKWRQAGSLLAPAAASGYGQAKSCGISDTREIWPASGPNEDLGVGLSWAPVQHGAQGGAVGKKCRAAGGRGKEEARRDKEVGVPVAHDKTVLPTTKLSYLGIEIDSEEGQVRLPMEKVLKARAAVVGMVAREKVTLREMQGLLGLLNFASRVIPMGRIFSRRLKRATVGVRRPLHKIRITRQLREDLKVWEAFLINFNGVRLWRGPPRPNMQLQLYTDAAAVGFGAFFQGQWCAERWPEAWHSQGLTRNLALLELFPIVVALELWVIEVLLNAPCKRSGLGQAEDGGSQQ